MVGGLYTGHVNEVDMQKTRGRSLTVFLWDSERPNVILQNMNQGSV